MFTGLVEEIGRVKAVAFDGGRGLVVAARTVLTDLNIGDSIAVDGACLTVTARYAESFAVGLAPETLARTTLGDLRSGAPVNLERAALPTTRLGGHYLQGHVDATGVVESVRPDGDALIMTVQAPRDLMRFVVPKGFVAVDGASLTVVHAGADWFDFTLVAFTRGKIALARKEPGDRVNLEADVIAKYVERLLQDAGLPRRAPAAIAEGAR